MEPWQAPLYSGRPVSYLVYLISPKFAICVCQYFFWTFRIEIFEIALDSFLNVILLADRIVMSFIYAHFHQLVSNESDIVIRVLCALVYAIEVEIAEMIG